MDASRGPHFLQITAPLNSSLQSKDLSLIPATHKLSKRKVNQLFAGLDPCQLFAFGDKLLIKHHVRPLHRILLAYTQYTMKMCIAQAAIPGIAGMTAALCL
jgi:hypothetical protein